MTYDGTCGLQTIYQQKIMRKSFALRKKEFQLLCFTGEFKGLDLSKKIRFAVLRPLQYTELVLLQEERSEFQSLSFSGRR